MKDANYAPDKHAAIHIGLSSLIVLGYLYYGIQAGHLSVGRVIFYLAGPIGCIWFPDAVAALKDGVISSRIIRFGGWCLLLIIILYPIFLRFLIS